MPFQFMLLLLTMFRSFCFLSTGSIEIKVLCDIYYVYKSSRLLNSVDQWTAVHQSSHIAAANMVLW